MESSEKRQLESRIHSSMASQLNNKHHPCIIFKHKFSVSRFLILVFLLSFAQNNCSSCAPLRDKQNIFFSWTLNEISSVSWNLVLVLSLTMSPYPDDDASPSILFFLSPWTTKQILPLRTSRTLWCTSWSPQRLHEILAKIWELSLLNPYPQL